VPSDPIHHAHELVHQGAGDDELKTADLAASDGVDDGVGGVYGSRLIALQRALSSFLSVMSMAKATIPVGTEAVSRNNVIDR